MATIEDLLHRRGDLSTFLVHLTRGTDGGGPSARENFLSILSAGCIEARTALGMAKDQVAPIDQRVVCFTETPLEHAWMMCQTIEGREHSLSEYGFVFAKRWARSRRVNPVWYLDITPGHDWLTVPINSLIDKAVEGADVAEIFKIAPFIEQMGPTCQGRSRKEFWWEREWRHRGNFAFHSSDLVAMFAPEQEHQELRIALTGLTRTSDRTPLLDPRWGMERMIAELAGVDAAHVGPM